MLPRGGNPIERQKRKRELMEYLSRLEESDLQPAPPVKSPRAKQEGSQLLPSPILSKVVYESIQQEEQEEYEQFPDVYATPHTWFSQVPMTQTAFQVDNSAPIDVSDDSDDEAAMILSSIHRAETPRFDFTQTTLLPQSLPSPYHQPFPSPFFHPIDLPVMTPGVMYEEMIVRGLTPFGDVKEDA